MLERYTYDAYGAPTFLNADGSIGIQDDDKPRLNSAYGNTYLFQGHEYDWELARAKRTPKTLADIANISLLRYANQLAPTAFGDVGNCFWR